jgi:RNA recognition motif-containing protein
MGNKIYVGNLPFSIGQDELKEAFSKFGDIEEAVVISDKFSGRSKGFGFVTFGKDEEAAKAVSEMNGKDLSGRELKVSEARPMDSDKSGSSSRPSEGTGNADAEAAEDTAEEAAQDSK